MRKHSLRDLPGVLWLDTALHPSDVTASDAPTRWSRGRCLFESFFAQSFIAQRMSVVLAWRAASSRSTPRSTGHSLRFLRRVGIAAEKLQVLVAEASGGIVVQEWQEDIPLAARNLSRLVQQRARKDDRSACRRREELAAELWKPEVAAVKFTGVEHQRNREFAMRGRFRRVVAMRTEVRSLSAVVTRHDVPLHACRLELVSLLDFGHQPIVNPHHAGFADLLVGNFIFGLANRVRCGLEWQCEMRVRFEMRGQNVI